MDSSKEQGVSNDLGIRRSGRSRTASSMYAKSIDQFKKVEVGRWQSLRKPGKSLRFADQDSGIPSNPPNDSCSMDLEENSLACRLPEGSGHRLIFITIVGPQKPTRLSRPVEPRSAQLLKRKSSAFKEPPKEMEKKQSNLLGMLLGAAIKVAKGPQGEEEEELPSDQGEQEESQLENQPEKPSETQNGEPIKKPEGRQRSKLAERDEDLKRLGKMQAKYNAQALRFQQLKGKLSILT